MKTRAISTIHNNKREKKQALKTMRKPIKDSKLTKAKKKLYKVKHASNDILFNNPRDPNRKAGGHYTVTVGANPHNDDVAVAVITSLEDIEGNPIKQDQLEKGLILPLDSIDGLSRKSGVKQEVITKNKYTNENIKYNSLQDLNPDVLIRNSNEKEKVYSFLYSNHSHGRSSERNNRRTKNYVK